jgi:hypothetical protein
MLVENSAWPIRFVTARDGPPAVARALLERSFR